jgi:hypothetical protein
MIPRIPHSIVPLVLATVVMFAGFSACAHPLQIKQAATTSLQAGEMALHDARIAELAFFDSHIDPKYGAPQHVAFLEKLKAAQTAEIASAKALQAWNPGDAAPSSVSDYLASAQAMLDIAKGIASSVSVTATNFLAKVQAVVDNANAVAKAIAGK